MVLPLEYVEKIQELNGRDVKLIIQHKTLTKVDVSPSLGRLLLRVHNNDDGMSMDEYMKDKGEATLLEPTGEYEAIRITTWSMGHSRYYALLNPWSKVVASNGFAQGDAIQVWAFRFGDEEEEEEDQLGLVLLPAPPTHYHR